MQRTLPKRIFYNAVRVLARLATVAGYRLRVAGREHWPAAGGGLVCSNHQSMFDPVLVGLTCDRRLNYLARNTLYKNRLFAWLIDTLDAIPIDREGSGLAGLKETLKRLKAGELVLIFPEGTRTRDGEVAHLKPGFCSVARRSRVPLIPVGIDGAYQAWPRTSPWPTFGRMGVVIGEPILPERIAELSDDELVAELEHRIRHCHSSARVLRSDPGMPIEPTDL
jgi:1-acyl-sn-glycerol-3-phosphate acyltransferase